MSLLPSIFLITLCKHSFHLPTAKIEIIYFKDFILYSQIVFVIIFALIIGVEGCAFVAISRRRLLICPTFFETNASFMPLSRQFVT